jgi:succinyl-CoA synthetase alpha subunit
MAILVNKHTRIITQGITGKAGQLNTRMCRDYANGNECFVAGVHPRKAGQDFEGIPIYGSVAEAKDRTGATVSVIYVPAASAAAAIDEAVDAGMELVVCVTTGIPEDEMKSTLDRMRGTKTRLLGPNCPGIITPGEIKIGIMPGHIHHKGHVGVVSRSGTLVYDVVGQLMQAGLGQSTCVGIGGDPFSGMQHIDAMQLFNDDPETEVVVMLGDTDSDEEETCAHWIKNNMKKPVVGFIAGAADPAGKHAGEIARDKIAVMEQCGIVVAHQLDEVGELVRSVLYEDSFWMMR